MYLKTSLFTLISVAALAYYFNLHNLFREVKIISTKSGAVRGVLSISRDGREFFEWLGIPYAKPPVGELRFASPQPIGKWAGVRDGSQFGSQCVQNNFVIKGFELGDEDCLFLNVHSPKLQDENKLLPVLFYMHGGGFIIGNSNTYRPEYLMDEDVVFVSINYRLDILGFLSTGDKVIRGNMGLKDQVQALKWVKENIQSFGGDPNKITIFGHSAGGASVHQLLLSPMTKGLFHKAISHSGAASNPWGFKSPKKSLETTKRVAKVFGCPVGNSQELAKCLRSASVKDLMRIVWNDMYEMPVSRPNKFGDSAVPTIETVDDGDAFLTQHPLQIIAQGKASRVPWMVGHTANEGIVSTAQLKVDENVMLEFEENYQECIKSIFSIQTCNVSSEKAEQINDYYFPPATRSTLSRENKLEILTTLFGDGFFNFDIHESVRLQRQFSSVYPYFFSETNGPTISYFIELICRRTFRGIIELVLFGGNTILGQYIFGMDPPQDDAVVDHTMDMVFLFPFYPLIQMTTKSKHYEFSKSYIKLVVDFASDESRVINFRGVEFPSTPKKGPLKFLEITNNDVPKIITEPFQDRMKFLHELNIRDCISKKSNSW